MDHDMQKKTRSFLIPAIMIVIAIVIIAVITALWATSAFRLPFERRPPPPTTFIRGDYELFYTLQTVVSVVNTTLSLILLLVYINIYRKTQSEFTIGLIIFSLVLLLQAFVSIPLLHRAFGFYEFGLGPFVLLPDLFTCLALAVLLYLTFEY